MELENTSPKPFVFILMPFSSDFSDIYELGIKQACLDAGAYCERVDEQNFDGSIVERIYNQISKADVIISDMTGKSPNVFYETGYAHALGKKTILLTQNSDDIPFDLKHFTHIVYMGSIVSLKKELQPKIEWAIQNPTKALFNPDTLLAFKISGKEIKDDSKIEIQTKTNITKEDLISAKGIRKTSTIRIDIQNLQNKPFDASNIQIGLEMPKSLYTALTEKEGIEIDEDTRLIMLKKLGYFLPKSWESISFSFNNNSLKNKINITFNLRLQIFTELGMHIIPFEISFIAET